MTTARSEPSFWDQDDFELLYLKYLPAMRRRCCVSSRSVALVSAYLHTVLYGLMSIYWFVPTDFGSHSIERDQSTLCSTTFLVNANVINIAASLLLLYGLHTERKTVMRAWLLIREIWLLQIVFYYAMVVVWLRDGGFGASYLCMLLSILELSVETFIIHNHYASLTAST